MNRVDEGCHVAELVLLFGQGSVLVVELLGLGKHHLTSLLGRSLYGSVDAHTSIPISGVGQSM